MYTFERLPHFFERPPFRRGDSLLRDAKRFSGFFLRAFVPVEQPQHIAFARCQRAQGGDECRLAFEARHGRRSALVLDEVPEWLLAPLVDGGLALPDLACPAEQRAQVAVDARLHETGERHAGCCIVVMHGAHEAHIPFGERIFAQRQKVRLACRAPQQRLVLRAEPRQRRRIPRLCRRQNL